MAYLWVFSLDFFSFFYAVLCKKVISTFDIIWLRKNEYISWNSLKILIKCDFYISKNLFSMSILKSANKANGDTVNVS